MPFLFIKRWLLLVALLLAPFAFLTSFRWYGRYAKRRAVEQRIAQFNKEAAQPNSFTHQLRDGDLIFHTSQSAQSRAIQLATHSTWSHCGILYREAGQWQVFEAVQPVKRTPMAEWVARGQGGHFVTKRLRDAATALTPQTLARLKAAGQPMLGHNYDLYFGWSDDRIYCSELIWKVYERGLHRRLGKLEQLRDFDLSHPAVQAKLRERYGPRLPLTETVISPASIFNSPELVTVLRR
jgi:hypothetical protein